MVTSKQLLTARIFLQFLYRDIYVHSQHFFTHFVNYSLLYPTMYMFCFAYLQTKIYFHGDTRIGAIVFAGTCLVPLLVMTFQISFDLLFDLEKNRHVDYQMMVLSPRLILIEQILFSSIFTLLIMTPFFPLARIFVSSYINLSNVSWPSLFLILYLGALCFSAYHKLAATILNVSKISMFWTRINYVLLILGGFWIPLHITQKFSPLLGLLLRLNPMIYFSEGLRQSIVGGSEFLSIAHCVVALLILSIIFTVLSWYFFKKRVDHL